MDKKTGSILKGYTSNDLTKSLMSQDEISMIFRKKTVLNDKFINDLVPSDENFFNIFFHCISRSSRTNLEISVIIKYLISLDSFMNLLYKSNCSVKDLTYTISSFIKYEYLPKDHILFRLGDKGDKYYIILKGSVTIMIPKETKVELTEEEFLNFVKRLISNTENEILYKTLIHNNNVFPNVYELLYKKTSDISRASRQMSLRNSIPNKIINEEDLQENIKFSVEDYINVNLPTINEKDKKERKVTTIFRYFNVVTLKAGDTFGEVALTSNSQKRTGTVISLEDCHLGTLDKKGYEKCLKESMVREKINIVNFLLSNHIFKGVPKDTFMSKFYNFFVRLKVSRGEKVIVEGCDSRFLYLIREGEFEISTYTSVSGLKDICRSLGDHTKEPIFEEFKKRKNTDLVKFMTEKKTHKLAIVREREILGMEYMKYNDKYAFTALCMKNNSEVFQLDNEMLKVMIDNDESIETNCKTFLKKKKSFYLKRLCDIKESLIDMFRKNKKSEMNQVSNNTTITSNFKTSANFLETRITLPSSTEKVKILKKKWTNFNLVFSKNTFSTNTNEKELNPVVTPKLKETKINLNSFNSIEKIWKKSYSNFGNPLSSINPQDKSPNLFTNESNKSPIKVISSRQTIRKTIYDLTKETEDEGIDDSINLKSVNTLSSHHDSTEVKTKTFLEYRNAYVKEKHRNFDPKHRIRTTSNENSSMDLTTLNLKNYLTGGFNIKKRDVLISSFLTNEHTEPRHPDKFNFVDCLAIDNLLRTYSNQTQIKKGNLCNQIQIGRAKYIFDKSKKPKLRKLSTIYNVSNDVQLTSNKYIDERKKVAINYSKKGTSLQKRSNKSLNKYSSYN